jgi:hypothetical protein
MVCILVPMSRIRLFRLFVLFAGLVSALALPVLAASEPPIVTFQALVTDSAGVTRRLETYPLLAAYPDRYIDLAGAPEIEALLKSHPALKFEELSPRGLKCSEIPVGLGPVQTAPLEGTTPGIDAPRQLQLAVFITSAPVKTFTASPVGVARPLPRPGEPSGPSSDPLDTIRRTAADRLGGPPERINLESYGDFDFNGDHVPETVLVAHVPAAGRPEDSPSFLMIAPKGQFSLPMYSVDLAPGSKVMGVGDINGDGVPEIVVKTSPSARDFGIEIHAWRDSGMQRVFERRSYGCY